MILTVIALLAIIILIVLLVCAVVLAIHVSSRLFWLVILTVVLGIVELIRLPFRLIIKLRLKLFPKRKREAKP